jgi:hypothetical protein
MLSFELLARLIGELPLMLGILLLLQALPPLWTVTTVELPDGLIVQPANRRINVPEESCTWVMLSARSRKEIAVLAETRSAEPSSCSSARLL